MGGKVSFAIRKARAGIGIWLGRNFRLAGAMRSGRRLGFIRRLKSVLPREIRRKPSWPLCAMGGRTGFGFDVVLFVGANGFDGSQEVFGHSASRLVGSSIIRV